MSSNHLILCLPLLLPSIFLSIRVFFNESVLHIRWPNLWCSAFFIVQLSHPYMTTGKTIALTRRTFVGKIISLLFNMPILLPCEYTLKLCSNLLLLKPVQPFLSHETLELSPWGFLMVELFIHLLNVIHPLRSYSRYDFLHKSFLGPFSICTFYPLFPHI